MKKKYLTLDDLYVFCKQNNFVSFSAKDFGAPMIVQSFGEFEADASDNSDLIPVKLQACHTLVNRNRSSISDKVMTSALPSFANKPILGYIHQLDDGSWDFYTHNISYVEDEESEDGIRVEYDERPIGVIPESCNAHLEYDKEKNKNYVVVNGYIYSLYGNRAIDIIKNNGGKTKVSVEIAVNEMSFNAKEDCLEIEDFEFLGVTCLGKTPNGETVEEGMEGSNLKIENFTARHNSMFGKDYSKIIDLLSNINKKLDGLSYNKFEEKGVDNAMNHFNELLEKYGKTLEDITFEYEGMSDEELDVKFAELFDGDGDSGNGETLASDAEGDADDGEETNPVADDNDSVTDHVTESVENEDNNSDTEGNKDETDKVVDDDVPGAKKKQDDFAVVNFKISHEDTRYGIQNLLNAQNGESHYYVVHSVYDGYFYYEDWMSSDAFKQSYKMRKDVISLSGDPIPVYREFITAEEKAELENMRKNYAALVEFKEKYDAAEIKAAKDAVLESAEYAEVRESDEFKALISGAEKYSVEEIKTKADLLFAAAMKKKLNFEAEVAEKKHSVGINFNVKQNKKKQAYGGLFTD